MQLDRWQWPNAMTIKLYHHQRRGVPYLSVGSLAYPGFVKLIGYFYLSAFCGKTQQQYKPMYNLKLKILFGKISPLSF